MNHAFVKRKKTVENDTERHPLCVCDGDNDSVQVFINDHIVRAAWCTEQEQVFFSSHVVENRLYKT